MRSLTRLAVGDGALDDEVAQCARFLVGPRAAELPCVPRRRSPAESERDATGCCVPGPDPSLLCADAPPPRWLPRRRREQCASPTSRNGRSSALAVAQAYAEAELAAAGDLIDAPVVQPHAEGVAVFDKISAKSPRATAARNATCRRSVPRPPGFTTPPPTRDRRRNARSTSPARHAAQRGRCGRREPTSRPSEKYRPMRRDASAAAQRPRPAGRRQHATRARGSRAGPNGSELGILSTRRKS